MPRSAVSTSAFAFFVLSQHTHIVSFAVIFTLLGRICPLAYIQYMFRQSSNIPLGRLSMDRSRKD
jgi:hypothetical protein